MNELVSSASALAHLGAIVQGSTDAIVSKSRSGVVQSWNPAAERMFGYTAEEMVGSSIRRIIPPDRQDEEEDFLSRISRGEEIRSVRTLRMRRDGVVFPVALTISPIRDEAGAVVGASKIARDLSDEQAQLAQLRESEERFHTLADNISQLAWMAHPDGDIFWYNKRWYDFTGTALGDVAGWGWRRVHHPDHVDRVVERIRHSWDTGEPWEDTFPLRAADGSYRWFLSRALPIRDAHGAIVRWFGTNTDVTDQRRQEEKIRLLMAELGHRAKNSLTLVQAIARQAATTAEERAFVERFLTRLQTLSASQDLLVQSGWQGADTEALIRAQLGHFRDLLNSRILLDGPPIQLTTSAVQVLGMALHELATNAAKYGALSVEGGRVDIWWRLREGRFEMKWSESAGPLVTPPAQTGFGSVVIERMARIGLEAEVDCTFAPSGLVWHLSCPGSAAVQSASDA